MVEQFRIVRVSCEAFLLRAELRAEIFFEGSNDFAAEIRNLRFCQRRFAALERYAHEQ